MLYIEKQQMPIISSLVLTGAWIEPTINLTLLEVSITTITRPIMLIGTEEYVNNGKLFEIVETSLR